MGLIEGPMKTRKGKADSVVEAIGGLRSKVVELREVLDVGMGELIYAINWQFKEFQPELLEEQWESGDEVVFKPFHCVVQCVIHQGQQHTCVLWQRLVHIWDKW